MSSPFSTTTPLFSSISPSTMTTTVSACGKVLLVGGYLVLESPNPGLVLAVDKRFYTTISNDSTTATTSTTTTTTTASNSCSTNIIVHSPQFHCTWEYVWKQNSEGDQSQAGGILEPSVENPSLNPFVENSLTLLCLYLPPKPRSDLRITIQGDNDFYSVLPHLKYRSSSSSDDSVVVTKEMVSDLPKCLPCPIDEETSKVSVNKTGLGSSAALTTSLVGAWCIHFTKNNVKDDDDGTNVTSNDTLDRIHNLAQICHCWAQGKIGSGFDVSAAVYGTHIYKRFPKCMLSDFLQQIEHHHHGDVSIVDTSSSQRGPSSKSSSSSSSSSRMIMNNSNEDIQDLLKTLVTTIPWKEDMQSFLPSYWSSSSSATSSQSKPQLQIVLADVCGGSESPSMAKLVLQWKQLHPLVSKPIWNELQIQNSKVMDLMKQIMDDMDLSEEYYDTLSHETSQEWSEDSLLKKLSDTFRQVRKLMKQMGESVGTVIDVGKKSDEKNDKDESNKGIPIEPDEQTKLCDATMELPGVIAAVVPGAGGYDAVACLYIDRPHVLKRIEELWSTFSNTSIAGGDGDSKDEGGVQICPLSAQVSTEGLRIEASPPTTISTLD